MKAISLADISYSDALDLLMQRKEALDNGTSQPLPTEIRTASLLVKAANNFLTQAKSWLADKANSAVTGYQEAAAANPGFASALNYGLAGAGITGAASLAHSAGTGNKNWKRKALRDSLLGGGAGIAANLLVNSPTIASNVADKLAPKLDPGSPASAATTPGTPAYSKADLTSRAYNYTPEATLAAHAGAAAIPGRYLYNLSKAPGLDRSLLTEQLRSDATKALATNASNPIAELTKKYNPMELNKLMGHGTNQATNPDLLKNLFKPTASAPGTLNLFGTNGTSNNQVIDHEDLYKLLQKSPALKQTDPEALARTLLQNGDDAGNFAKKIVSPGLLETNPGGGHKWSLGGIKPGKRVGAGGASAALAGLLLSGLAGYKHNLDARAAARAQLGDNSPSNVREHMNAVTGGILE